MKKDDSIRWQRIDAGALELKGWNVAVVGGTGGLGRALSRLLAARGAHVTVVGQTFRDAGTPGIEFVQADLSRMVEAERIAQALPGSLDLVVLTTGTFAAPRREVTAEGIERDMAVSYLSRLVILRALAPRLGVDRAQERGKPRVFVMGYPGTGQAGNVDDLDGEKAYDGFGVHMNTVAGNEMLVLDGARRHPHVNVYGLNPGLIKTNIRDNFFGKGSFKGRVIEGLIGLFTPSPDTYAARIAPLLVSPDIEGHSGALFDPKGNAILPTPKLTDVAYVDAFLAASTALVARAGVQVPS